MRQVATFTKICRIGQLLLVMWLSVLLVMPTVSFASITRESVFERAMFPVMGNPNGAITVVNFADYACYPCKSMNRTLLNLVKQDNRVRVVLVDYPMLGQSSLRAAQAAIAGRDQGKYLRFHQALMKLSVPIDEQKIWLAARQGDVNLAKLKSDMENQKVLSALLNNLLLGNMYGIKSMPGFVVAYTQAPHNATVFTGEDGRYLLQVVKAYETKL